MSTEADTLVEIPQATAGFELLGKMAISDPDAAHDSIISEEGALLLVDKPYAETSFFVVNRIRRAITESTGIKWVKVGHAGTLDPLATGLLIIATRRKTKALHQLTGTDKSYIVTLRLGVTSPSFDLEQPIEITQNAAEVKEEQLRSVLNGFIGEQLQVPPIYSAIKQDGRAVYHKARRGETPEMTGRSIVVHSVEVREINFPFVTFRVSCSKGTYVRSLVRDIGDQLSTGAVLVKLVRDRVGEWKLSDALSLEEAVTLARPPVPTSISFRSAS